MTEPIITILDLAKLAQRMRAAQMAYFKSRPKSDGLRLQAMVMERQTRQACMNLLALKHRPEYINQVLGVLDAQHKYFKSRLLTDMRESIRLERLLDKETARIIQTCARQAAEAEKWNRMIAGTKAGRG